MPLDSVPWDSFELLALDYLRAIGGWQEPRLYGSRGHAQRGIDLIDIGVPAKPSCQVKRKKRFGPSDLRGAVEKWSQDPPLDSQEFSVMVSRKASPALIEELVSLRQRYAAVRLDLIGASHLNDELRQQPALVRRHFHPAWVEAFCDPDAIEQLDQRDQRAQRLSWAMESSDRRQRVRLLAAGLPQDIIGDVLESSREVNRARLRDLPDDPVVVIVGPYGAGKSALLDTLVHTQAAACLADANEPAPLFAVARDAPGDLADLLDGHPKGEKPPFLLVDGIDEVSVARGRELVAQAIALAESERVARAYVSSRPGERLVDVKTWEIPPLAESEAENLVSLVTRREQRLWTIPHPAREAVRRPLFALIAGRLRATEQPVPTSDAQFISVLVRDALAAKTEKLTGRLTDLAVATLGDGRGVTRQIARDDFERRELLSSRLVFEDNGSLQFSLPIIEQYFAALALLRDEALFSLAVADKVRFDR